MAVVVIDAVTTGDVTPAVAPHRISAKPTKDVAQIAFTPTTDEIVPSEALYPSATLYPGSDAAVVGARIVVGGASPYTGKLVGRLGLPCSESLACSESLPCSDWESPSGVQVEEDVTAAELIPEADGDKTVNIWCTSLRGWF